MSSKNIGFLNHASANIPERITTTSPDLIGYTGRKYSDGQIRIIVRFDGALDEDRLRKAVRLTFDAEPVTGCRFVEKPIRPYWSRCDDLENSFTFQLIQEMDLDKEVDDYLLVNLDPYKGPQVNVGLFRSDSDTLVIKMSHIVADGGASFEYLQLLSYIYRHLGEDPSYQPVPNIQGSRNAFQVLRHVSLSKLLVSCIRVSTPKSSWIFQDTEKGEIKVKLIIRRLDKNRLSRIKAYAKSRNFSMGDILATVIYRALFEEFDQPENVHLEFLVSVNTRKHIPGGHGEGICNLSAGYFLKMKRNKSQSFEDTLNIVHTLMEEKKTKQEELWQLFLSELAFAPGYIVPRVLGLNSRLTMPSISNFGVINPKVADFGNTPVREILPTGPIMYPPVLLFGASTFRDELVLTATVSGVDSYLAKVERLMDKILGDLPN